VSKSYLQHLKKDLLKIILDHKVNKASNSFFSNNVDYVFVHFFVMST